MKSDSYILKIYITLLSSLSFMFFGSCAEHRDQPEIYAAASLAPYLDCQKAVCSFEASSRLARKIAGGATPDVFISADPQWVTYLEKLGLVQEKRVVATGTLVLVSARQNLPEHPRLAIASRNAPAGRYASSAIKWAGIKARLVEAPNVRGALRWAMRGVVDGAVVYGSDAASARKNVHVLRRFPPESHDPILYVAMIPVGAPHPAAAHRYMDMLSSGIRGLGPPPGATIFTKKTENGFSADRQRNWNEKPRFSGTYSGPSPSKAIMLSASVASLSILFSLPLAVATGWILSRKRFRGRSVLLIFIMAPMVMPPVVTGYILLELFRPGAPLGSILSSLGLSVPFTFAGAVMAASVVGFPLFALSARSAFDTVDRRLENVAMSMGITPSEVFRRVTLPLALPGIGAGALLAFARAMGEFGATAVLAGNVEGNTRTIPLAIYTILESPDDSGLSVLLWASLVISFLALLGYERLIRSSGRRE